MLNSQPLYRYLSLITWFLLFSLTAQSQTIKGVVTNSKTGEPLPFVNVVAAKSKQGTTTDLDGRFALRITDRTDSIICSYIGYDKKKIGIRPIQKFYTIKLKPSALDIEEVVVKPGYNPAHRIIRLAYENLDDNDPKNLKSYKYKAYNKFIFTVDTSSEATEDSVSISDTLPSETDTLPDGFDKQHLFLTESISEVKYKKPGNKDETIIASKASGFKNPRLLPAYTKLEPVDFYDEVVKFNEKYYLNPVNKGFKNKYYFQIVDTLFDGEDTVFTISFKPNPRKNFLGFKGQLHIHTDGYALSTVDAEFADSSGFNNEYQQIYEQIGDSIWFPKQLKSNSKLPGLYISVNDKGGQVMVEAKTYIREIEIEPELRSRDFSHVLIDIRPDAHLVDDTVWQNFRPKTLDSFDFRTYEFWGKLADSVNFEKYANIIDIVLNGKIPWKWISFPFADLLQINEYEGVRLGLGIETNRLLSTRFKTGANFAYGFKDKLMKYGGFAEYQLIPSIDLRINTRFEHDVFESGGTKFWKAKRPLRANEYRQFLIPTKYIEQSLSPGFSFRSFKNLETRVSYRRSRVWANDDSYQWNYREADFSLNRNSLNLEEAQLDLRFAPGEQYVRYGNIEYSLNGNHPLFLAQVKYGELGIQDYLRVAVDYNHKVFIKNLGESEFHFRAGAFRGPDLPFYFFNGIGNKAERFTTFLSANSFQTMRLNEFVNRNFASLFYTHNFGSLLFKKENFSPAFKLSQAVGWGYNGRDVSFNDAEDMRHGYLESGLIIDDLVSFGEFNIGMGVGIFFRYGPYHLPNIEDNFTFALTFSNVFSNF